MDFNEPYEVWLQHKREQRLHEQAELRMRRPALPQMADEIMHIVADHNQDEITHFQIINEYSARAGARGRKDRIEARLKALDCIRALRAVRLLEWGNRRNHLRLAPPEKFEQYVERRREEWSHLPRPVLD